MQARRKAMQGTCCHLLVPGRLVHKGPTVLSEFDCFRCRHLCTYGRRGVLRVKAQALQDLGVDEVDGDQIEQSMSVSPAAEWVSNRVLEGG